MVGRVAFFRIKRLERAVLDNRSTKVNKLSVDFLVVSSGAVHYLCKVRMFVKQVLDSPLIEVFRNQDAAPLIQSLCFIK